MTRTALSLMVMLALAALGPTAPLCGERVLVQGLADLEGWSTGNDAEPIDKNEGDPAGLWRTRLWSAAQVTDRVQGFAQIWWEGGRAAEDGETEVDLQQAWLRWSFAAPRRLVVQAGRIVQPVGGFSARYLSNRNPLIGAPLNYQVSYPLGAQVAGGVGWFDYLVALVDEPPGLAPTYGGSDPRSSLRPALAVGLTPTTGLRLGGWGTRGTYMSREQDEYLADGDNWRDFMQTVTGLDLAFSRGHFELNSELTDKRYEMPGRHPVDTRAWYVEPKYTWSPRWYTALRLNKTRYADPEIDATGRAHPHVQRLRDAEAGVGFRIDHRTLVKASYRIARKGEYYGYGPVTDHALAVQVSHSFDAISWFEKPR